MKIILYILLMLTQVVYSQSRLDSLILEEVNSYRTSLNLQPVTFSNDCFEVSETHTKKLVDLKDSIFRFGAKPYHSGRTTGGEVIAPIVNYRISIDEKDPDSILAKAILNKWKESKEHNRIITSEKYKFTGVSTKMVEDKKIIKVWNKDEQKFKSIYTYTLFSTMNFK